MEKSPAEISERTTSDMGVQNELLYGMPIWKSAGTVEKIATSHCRYRIYYFWAHHHLMEMDVDSDLLVFFHEWLKRYRDI